MDWRRVEAEKAKRLSGVFAGLEITRSEKHGNPKLGKLPSNGKADDAIWRP